MDDSGIISLCGFCAGNRASPLFDWVRNFTAPHLTDDDVKWLCYQQSSSFTLMWNIARSKFPPEIMETFDKFIEENSLVRINEHILKGGSGNRGHYSLFTNGEELVFKGCELAPPSGVCAENYAKHTHYEKQPHPYLIVWTTSRTGSPSDRGNFYNASYGIRMEAAPNTMFAWQPKHVHTTSLQRVGPRDSNPAVCQAGLSVVTSNRLVSAFKKANRYNYRTVKDIVEDLQDFMVEELVEELAEVALKEEHRNKK